MDENLLYKFKELNPKFADELGELSTKSKNKFLKKLNNEKQEKNFLSIISEFKFCQLLELEGIEYSYEPKIGNKTPDFLIRPAIGQTIYFDVKRFNTSDSDSNNRRKLHELCKKLKTIKKPYYIQVDHVSDKINSSIDEVFSKAKNWITNENRKKDDSCILNAELKIKIVKVDGIKDHVLYLFRGNNPKIHIAKPKSDILDKLKVYQKDIIDNDIPFFVAIDLTFGTLRDPFDYWFQFLGGYSMEDPTGIESFMLGEFYWNNELNSLAGLLIRYNNEFYWLNNPRNKTNIDFKNVKFGYK